QRPIGERLHPAFHGAVPDQRRLLAPPGGHVAVQAVEARVQPRARKPPTVRAGGEVENAIPAAFPADGLCHPGPPASRIAPPRRALDLVFDDGRSLRGLVHGRPPWFSWTTDTADRRSGGTGLHGRNASWSATRMV